MTSLQNATAIDELNVRIKYLEDRLNSLARKQTDFEADQSDFVDRLGRVEQSIQDNAQFQFRMGEFHGGYANELGEMKHKYQELLLMVAQIQEDFNRHLQNRP